MATAAQTITIPDKAGLINIPLPDNEKFRNEDFNTPKAVVNQHATLIDGITSLTFTHQSFIETKFNVIESAINTGGGTVDLTDLNTDVTITDKDKEDIKVTLYLPVVQPNLNEVQGSITVELREGANLIVSKPIGWGVKPDGIGVLYNLMLEIDFFIPRSKFTTNNTFTIFPRIINNLDSPLNINSLGGANSSLLVTHNKDVVFA
jgi:hypothetical protein